MKLRAQMHTHTQKKKTNHKTNPADKALLQPTTAGGTADEDRVNKRG